MYPTRLYDKRDEFQFQQDRVRIFIQNSYIVPDLYFAYLLKFLFYVSTKT